MRATPLVLLLLPVLSSSKAEGLPPASASEPTFVVGSSHCPEPSDVAHEAIQLTPLAQRPIYESGVRVEVDDLGERYRVRVFAPSLLATKTYADPNRECARRTTFAAVLVFMTLMPPQLAEDPSSQVAQEGIAEKPERNGAGAAPHSNEGASLEAPPLPKNAPQSTPGAPTGGEQNRTDSLPQSRRSWARVALGVGSTWSLPVARALGTGTWDVSMQTSVGPNSFRPFLAVTYARSSEFELAGIAGTVRRWPAAVGLAWHASPATWDVGVGLGAVAVLERVQGRGLLSSHSQSAVELGARLAASGVFGRGLVSPFVALALDWFPEPRAISIAPRGEIGTTPVLQIAASLGVHVAL